MFLLEINFFYFLMYHLISPKVNNSETIKTYETQANIVRFPGPLIEKSVLYSVPLLSISKIKRLDYVIFK